ncbi:MAG: hypothetical protein A3F18_07605 [Legionellales bacterium RIFCSPHIGHO2_12_FULL_37_14]|nr:MAG: hypothetical protein A3F18_07605 [Legionellales bacterium RIFCSPHIGHO2_12_FULL_37_14]
MEVSSRGSLDLPIVVDLDGSLIKTDTLHELLIRLLHRSPLIILALFFWLLYGKARFKLEVAKRVSLNPSTLPYNQELLKWLVDQKSLGRKVILCTAADQSVALSIANYLGVFDSVIASDGKININGVNKRLALQKILGGQQYDYAGNSASDMGVWRGARKIIVVNARKAVLKGAQKIAEVDKVIPRAPRMRVHWRQVFRIHQWIKNLLLFVPLLAAHQIDSLPQLQKLLLAFISFSTCASAVYIINDLLDLESDRQHPRKCHRPFASGAVPIAYGFFGAPFLLAVSFILALAVNQAFFMSLLVYFFLTIVYSMRLKRFALIDCLALCILYTCRIVSGSIASEVTLSFWLLAFSIFIFLSLALVKRYSELQLQASQGNSIANGRGYYVSDAPLIQTLGVTSGYAAVLILALYVNSESVVSLYTQPQIIWFAIPLMLFWISWVWMIAHRNMMNDDPIIFAIKDKTSRFVAFLLVVIFGIASKWNIN